MCVCVFVCIAHGKIELEEGFRLQEGFMAKLIASIASGSGVLSPS